MKKFRIGIGMTALLIGLIFMGNDGDWFPQLNLGGVCIMAIGGAILPIWED